MHVYVSVRVCMSMRVCVNVSTVGFEPAFPLKDLNLIDLLLYHDKIRRQVSMTTNYNIEYFSVYNRNQHAGTWTETVTDNKIIGCYGSGRYLGYLFFFTYYDFKI